MNMTIERPDDKSCLDYNKVWGFSFTYDGDGQKETSGPALLLMLFPDRRKTIPGYLRSSKVLVKTKQHQVDYVLESLGTLPAMLMFKAQKRNVQVFVRLQTLGKKITQGGSVLVISCNCVLICSSGEKKNIMCLC